MTDVEIATEMSPLLAGPDDGSYRFPQAARIPIFLRFMEREVPVLLKN